MSRASNPQSPALSRGGVTGLGIDAALASPALSSTSALPATPRAKNFAYLLRPEIYQPLALTTVPQPFRTAEQQPDATTPLADLLASGHFRAAATVAAQQLTDGTIEPTDHARIFSLLYTRLACLLLLDATPIAAQEAKALEDLNSAFYLDDTTGAHLAPWELRVLHVRLMALSFSDPRRAVMSYYELAREARAQIAEAMATHDNSARELWKGRLAELGIKVAGALIEMEDLTGAAAHLASMSADHSAAGAPPKARTAASRRLDIAKALLWLQLGDADEARAAIHGGSTVQGGGVDLGALASPTAAESDGGDLAPRVVAALCDMADGEYQTALASWQELHEDVPEDEMISVNLAVCLVYIGRMVEGRKMLEGLVDAGYSSHTLLFNLSTMYELCTDRSKALKQGLAQRVADMGASPSSGWEKSNAAFKL